MTDTPTATATVPDTTTNAPAPTDTNTAPTDTTILQSGSIVKPDGSFVDGWRDSLPDELKGEKSLEVIKTLPDLVKRTVNAEKMVGKNKVPVPTEKSSPAEWDAYYAAGGRPKSSDDYKMDVPEDFKAIFTDERMSETRKIAHTLGLSQKQFEGLMKHELEASAKVLSEVDQSDDRQRQENELALKKEWGAAYDERIHIANRIIAEAFGPDKEGELKFLQQYGNDPGFIKFAATVGAKLVEHKALIATYTGVNSPGEALAKIKELQSTPGYMTYDGSYTTADGKRAALSAEERQRITDKIREQYKIAYPEPARRSA